ncbi:hypothetical protein PMIN02_009951 [Paraphaeosphaeria minitans]
MNNLILDASIRKKNICTLLAHIVHPLIQNLVVGKVHQVSDFRPTLANTSATRNSIISGWAWKRARSPSLHI